MLKTLQSVAVARAIALRGELELAAEVGVTVNRLTLMAAGTMEVPLHVFLRASEIITQNSMADAEGVSAPLPDEPAKGDPHPPGPRR
jgi:hypothetical protein